MDKKLKSFFFFLISAFSLGLALMVIPSSQPVLADTGPKPQINITIKNSNPHDDLYFGFFSSTNSGPNLIMDEEAASNEFFSAYLEDPIIQKFYQAGLDNNGYYFMKIYMLETGYFHDTNYLGFSYFAPSNFKLGIFEANSGSLIITNPELTKYTFQADYVLDLQNIDFGALSSTETNYITASSVLTPDPNVINNNIFRLLGRIILTMVIELAIAILFKYRKFIPLLTIAITNLITQIGLNFFVFNAYKTSGDIGYTISLIIAEAIVFSLEALVYYTLFRFFKRKEKMDDIGHPILYALVANAVTLAITFIPLLAYQ